MSALTDVVIFDVHDELGQGVEVKSAAPEPARVGKERSSGNSCHGRCYIGGKNEGRQQTAAAAAGISGETAGEQRWEQLERCGDELRLSSSRATTTGSKAPPLSLQKHKIF